MRINIALGLDCAGLVTFYIENSRQPRHLEQVIDSLVQIYQSQLTTTLIPNPGVGLNQLAENIRSQNRTENESLLEGICVATGTPRGKPQGLSRRTQRPALPIKIAHEPG